jgi:anaerobic magnesium-protoporphyrin IX monomethyl ester cyclase
MIVLVNPPNPPGAVSNKDTMGGLGQLYPAGTLSKMPPLDLLHCAAVLRQRRIPFEMLECLGANLDCDRFLERIGRLPAQLVAIRTSLPTFDWDLEVAALVKRVTGAPIIIFGPCTVFLKEEALGHDAIDGALLGEPEEVLAEVAQGGLDAGHPSLVTRKIVSGAALHPALIDNLDVLPFPAWDLTPYLSYSGTELMRNITPFATMLTSRGCAHGCMYCPYPVTQGRRLRYHSVSRVVEEMLWLQNELGIRSVLFRDPEFAINRERVVTLCEEIMRRGVTIAWRCETRIENLDSQLIELMARAGCFGLNMGIESLDAEVLNMLGRKAVPLAQVQSVLCEARKRGVETFCFFILGLPGETIKSSLDTISSAVELGCNHLQFTSATPYPGTLLHDWAMERGYLEDHSRSLLTGYHPVMQNGHLSAHDISDLSSYAGSSRTFRLWSEKRKSFALLELLRIGKLGLRIALQKQKLLRRSRALGE